MIRLLRDHFELLLLPVAFGLLLWLAFASLDVIDPSF